MNESELNDLGQPVGRGIAGWKMPLHPSGAPMEGRFCRLERLDPAAHAADLFEANRMDKQGRNWTYLPYGPFDSLDAYGDWMASTCMGDDPLFFAIVDAEARKAVGVASFMRIDAKSGSIEIGHLNFSPLLQKRPAATEAIYMMMARAFEGGYRRCEWKCNAFNAASRRAAQRFGFSFEGIFRQATVVKGRNRDTAWYSAMDHEWPALSRAFSAWLHPSNFDEAGRQRECLSAATRPLLASTG